MKLGSGILASMALTVGALLLLVAVDSSDSGMISGRRPPKTSFLRSHSSRKLYNYSNNNNNYNDYSGSYGGNNDGASSYSGSYGSGSYGSGSYGSGSYGSGSYGSGSYGSGSYGSGSDGNVNYGYENDDTDDYRDDDASYYSSNQNNKASGSSYNGRDQQWGGQSVQQMADDEEPEIEVEAYDEDERWAFLSMGGLSGTETFALVGLALAVSLSLLCLMMLAGGVNVIDLCNLYCCCGVFGHKDQKLGESVEDGFVKLGDY